MTRKTNLTARSEAPRLNLTFQVKPRFDLSIESWNEIVFVITRAADDPQRQTCIIYWDPIDDGFNHGDILLFRHEAGQLQHVHPNQLSAKSVHPRQVSASDSCFKQLDPGDRVSWWKTTLSSTTFGCFKNGQSCELFWKGGQIHLWDWGTLEGHGASQLVPRSPAIVLPSGSHQSLSFTDEESDIEDEVILWPPSPRPLSPSARINGAPAFSMSISGPDTISMSDRTPSEKIHYPVTVTISYDVALGLSDEKRPIIFHTPVFKDIDTHYDGFRLYVKHGDEWNTHEVNPIFMHHAYRFSTPEPLNVGHNDRNQFKVLRPGQSWIFAREVSDFPKNAAPGHQFRYQFKGTSPRWWDWGNSQDHEDTVVWVVEDKLNDPKDNGGRPAIIVPASNWIEFELVT